MAASSVEEEDALKALAAATGDGAKAESKAAKATPKAGSKTKGAPESKDTRRKARGQGQAGGAAAP